MTKRFNLFPTLLSAVAGLILTGSVGSFMLRASAAEPAFVPMACYRRVIGLGLFGSL
jgi:hypothetical protein